MAIFEYTSLIEREVDRLFKEHPPVYDKLCTNPVTGADYVGILDPTKKQKRAACRALLARQYFHFHAPPDVPPLPIHWDDWWDARYCTDLLRIILAMFTRSLECLDHDFVTHPSFADYVSGFLWEIISEDGARYGQFSSYEELPKLIERFPPRKLEVLLDGCIWKPPKEQAKTMKSSCRRHAALRLERGARGRRPEGIADTLIGVRRNH
jgi:hypothetical protein